MNESKKIKIAKEIKINYRIIIYSVIIGIISYPLLALNDGGFKAISLRNNGVKTDVIPSETSYSHFREKCKEFSDDVFILGDKNNTLEKRMTYAEWRFYDNILFDSIYKKIGEDYLVLGTVYNISIGGDNPNIGVYYYANYETLSNTIEKIFGRFGIVRSLWIFFFFSTGIISIRYLYIFTKQTIKWVKKYSQ